MEPRIAPSDPTKGLGILDLRHNVNFSNCQIVSNGAVLIAFTKDRQEVCFIFLKTGKPFSKVSIGEPISTFIYMETRKQLICLGLSKIYQRSNRQSSSAAISFRTSESKVIQITDNLVAAENNQGLLIADIDTLSAKTILPENKCQFTRAKINHYIVTLCHLNSKIVVIDAKTLSVALVIETKKLDYYYLTNLSAFQGDHILAYGYNEKGVNLRTFEFTKQNGKMEIVAGKCYVPEKSSSNPFLLALGPDRGIVKFSMSDPVCLINIDDKTSKEVLFSCRHKVDLLYLSSDHKKGVGIENLSGDKITKRIMTLKLS